MANIRLKEKKWYGQKHQFLVDRASRSSTVKMTKTAEKNMQGQAHVITGNLRNSMKSARPNSVGEVPLNTKTAKFGGAKTGIYSGEAGSWVDYACFAAGTEILMADGSLKNIAHISIGDQIIDADYEITTVLNKSEKIRDDVLAVYHVQRDYPILVTSDHPFLTSRRRRENDNPLWVQSRSLVVGIHMLLSPGKKTAHLVDLVDVRPGDHTVYDLETGSHTFIADGVIVHNCVENNRGGSHAFADIGWQEAKMQFDRILVQESARHGLRD